MIRWMGNVRQVVSRLARAGCGLLFPPQCVCCDCEIPAVDGQSMLCVECLARLGPATWNGCRRCGGQIRESESSSERCPRCKHARLQFDAAVTLGSYHAGLRAVVLHMKRPSHEPLSLAMGSLLAQRRREQLLEQQPDLIIPIPMFWMRRLGRGVNSPDIVARCLGQSLGRPVRRDILVRRRNTLPQARLSPTRRVENVRGAFRIRRGQLLQDARVLLVDDILTTGATCSEAAKMLKRAGAATVAVAVIARVEGHRQR